MLQVNIHDAVMLKVSLKRDSGRFSAWRPWTARQYVVPSNSIFSSRTDVLISGVVAAVVLGLGVVVIAVRACCNRRRFAQREGGKKTPRPGVV